MSDPTPKLTKSVNVRWFCDTTQAAATGLAICPRKPYKSSKQKHKGFHPPKMEMDNNNTTPLLSSQTSNHNSTQPRRLRGFAARAASLSAEGIPSSTTTPPDRSTTTAKGRKEREKEKERTKLRERHRRSITSRMLAGLRQYGNFTLPARADMNDVLAALAREAGWTVESDGTTYRSMAAVNLGLGGGSGNYQAPYHVRSIESPLSTASMKNGANKGSIDCQPSILGIDENFSPRSLGSGVVAEREPMDGKYPIGSPINSSDCIEADQLIQSSHLRQNENEFGGTPYIPVYVILDVGIINGFCQLVDSEGIKEEFAFLKSLNVNGVVVTCWWGIVECWSSQKYVWSGYRELFNICREFKMKLQVVMAFHECEGSGDTPRIFLPKWILDIGNVNEDIFFTGHDGRRNTECLSWGVDKERVLLGRTGIEVYYDFMRSFRTEFDDLFEEGLISAVEIGLGSSGELKYPSFAGRMGWRYPGIGEFQCYDKYMQQSLRDAAGLRRHPAWARGPENAGEYNSRPHETTFFCDRGDYDSSYGRFFLNWYTQALIAHSDNVLSLATLVFQATEIIVKLPSIYWWYKTSSHAAELTAGFYNPSNQDGYSRIFEALKKHFVTLKFVCPRLQFSTPEDDALSDPEGLSWQVLNSAWDCGLTVAAQSKVPFDDKEECTRTIETAKPRNDPDQRHVSFFVYQEQSSSSTDRETYISDLDSFIKCMHGEVVCDMQA